MHTTFHSKLNEVGIGAKWWVVASVQNYFEHAHHFIVVQNKMLGKSKTAIGAKQRVYACNSKPW